MADGVALGRPKLSDLCTCGREFAIHGAIEPYTIGATRKAKACPGFHAVRATPKKRQAGRKGKG